jgi:hypothetical protein
MMTLRMMTIGMVFAVTATAAMAAVESNVPTITVTAKRPHSTALVVERVPPRAAIDATLVLPTYMPEAEIDYRLSPIGTSPAPAVEQVTT